MIKGLAALLLLHGLVRAYPADSLLLTQITSIGTLADTLKVQKFAYSRDNQGNWYKTVSEFHSDSLRSKKFKTYDAKGLVVAESSTAINAKGFTVTLSTHTDYNAAGRPVHATLIENDTIFYTYAYMYDASGKVQKWTIASVSPAFTSYYLYTYDPQGRLLDKKRYVGDTVKEATRAYYDGNGRLTAQCMFNAKGDTTEWDSYAYDSLGRRTRETSRMPDSLSLLDYEKRTAYDAVGNVISVTWYEKSGYLESTDEYAYQTIGVPLAILAWRPGRGSPGGWMRNSESGSTLGWSVLGRRSSFRISDPVHGDGGRGPIFRYPANRR